MWKLTLIVYYLFLYKNQFYEQKILRSKNVHINSGFFYRKYLREIISAINFYLNLKRYKLGNN